MSVSPRTRAARVTARVLVPLLATLGLAVIPGVAQADAACPGPATITNGTVTLGVNCLGTLGTSDGTGLSFGGREAVSQGKAYEGWGVSDGLGGATGWANQSSANDSDPASSNVSLVSFTSTSDTAVSVVDVAGTFRVTQTFAPAGPATPNLFAVTVEVTNISGAPTDLRYRRVMDWDIAPTPQHEYVTLQQGSASTITYTSDDGFASANPQAAPSKILASGTFVDSGPTDHGALFDFDFGTLPKDGVRAFKVFYGATQHKAQALAALTSVEAEAYSLGQPYTSVPGTNGADDTVAVDDSTNTFVFGFKDIGGTSAAINAPFAVGDRVNAVTAQATDVRRAGQRP